MRNRCVGLVTGDPALYADLASALRERRTPSVSLWPGERIPDRVAVVLTSPAEAGRIAHPRVLAVPPESERTALWAAVEIALRPGSSSSGQEIVVGIDPGPCPGYSVLSSGRLLVEGVLPSPEASRELAVDLARRFPGRGIRYRVGSGDPPARNRIVRALEPGTRDVELVNEAGTSPRIARRHRDAAAARAIARLPGRRLSHTPTLRPTPGAITQVQRLSREGSNGRFTISRALAEKVLTGVLTLPDALREGERHPPLPATRNRAGSPPGPEQSS